MIHEIPPNDSEVRPLWEPGTAKQIQLLSAAEESYSQAASVLKPILDEFEAWPPRLDDRLEIARRMLEEAMAAHNRYMDSLK